ncbi:hypothetical protein [Halomonas sp. DWK9]|uniref:hypothetical protein n=1 Tax=Halomonas sp. DWK9 TaxID=3060155 RepID=UPI00287FA888|nr:hypothetical protein [Halomonas sp. DWK9]
MTQPWFTPPKAPAEMLADAQKAKINEINDAYIAAATPLIREYPQIEQQSWSEQIREARTYLAWAENPQGDRPDTPVLDNILLGRNGKDGTETLQELCEAVVNNAEKFTQFQQLTGRRHRLVKMVKNASQKSVVDHVSWADDDNYDFI